MIPGVFDLRVRDVSNNAGYVTMSELWEIEPEWLLQSNGEKSYEISCDVESAGAR